MKTKATSHLHPTPTSILAKIPAVSPDLSFEDALHELEQMVSQMDNGQMPLEQAIQAYQRGSTLVQHCQDLLARSEQVIRVYSESGLKPFSESN